MSDNPLQGYSEPDLPDPMVSLHEGQHMHMEITNPNESLIADMEKLIDYGQFQSIEEYTKYLHGELLKYAQVTEDHISEIEKLRKELENERNKKSNSKLNYMGPTTTQQKIQGTSTENQWDVTDIQRLGMMFRSVEIFYKGRYEKREEDLQYFQGVKRELSESLNSKQTENEELRTALINERNKTASLKANLSQLSNDIIDKETQERELMAVRKVGKCHNDLATAIQELTKTLKDKAKSSAPSKKPSWATMKAQQKPDNRFKK